MFLRYEYGSLALYHKFMIMEEFEFMIAEDYYA
jgi:hypothetical protein